MNFSRSGKVVYLNAEDIADPSRDGMAAVKPEIERQCVDADVVICGDRILQNRLGPVGVINPDGRG